MPQPPTAAEPASHRSRRRSRTSASRRTWGPKDRPAILELGKRTGTDLFGEEALAVLRQAKNPKDPKVFGEISRHITELQDIEKTYLQRGNTAAAAHAARTIAQLQKLIGVTDRDAAKQNAAIDAARRDANTPRRSQDASARRRLMLTASRQAAAAGQHHRRAHLQGRGSPRPHRGRRRRHRRQHQRHQAQELQPDGQRLRRRDDQHQHQQRRAQDHPDADGRRTRLPACMTHKFKVQFGNAVGATVHDYSSQVRLLDAAGRAPPSAAGCSSTTRRPAWARSS